MILLEFMMIARKANALVDWAEHVRDNVENEDFNAALDDMHWVIVKAEELQQLLRYGVNNESK